MDWLDFAATVVTYVKAPPGLYGKFAGLQATKVDLSAAWLYPVIAYLDSRYNRFLLRDPEIRIKPG